MTDHYTTLGVARDATPAEIKAAYRRASSAAHPDKGGSTERMQAVNRAYEVLSDPERRQQYDVNGSDGHAETPEETGHATLVQAFRQALEQVSDTADIVGHVREQLQGVKLEIANRQGKLRRKREKLTKQRGRVKVKSGGANIVHALIDHQLAEAQAEIDGLERVSESTGHALTLLDGYEFVPPEGAPPVARPAERSFEDVMRESMQSGTFGSPFRRPW